MPGTIEEQHIYLTAVLLHPLFQALYQASLAVCQSGQTYTGTDCLASLRHNLRYSLRDSL